MVKDWMLPPQDQEQSKNVCCHYPYSASDQSCSQSSKAKKKKKEMQGVQIRKERINLSLFADDIIAYVENPKKSTKTFLE